MVGHITPEAFDGGLLALVQDDDWIEIDVLQNRITLKIIDSEIESRKKAWQQPPLGATKGVLFKYAKSVSTAADGCVTDVF